MKAMVLAAGFGTRLRPLTSQRPKALVPVANRPIIDRIIAYLKSFGFQEVIVNAHHYEKQLVDHLKKGAYGIKIHVRVEPKILGTGGGIKNTEDFWDEEPFVVINGDILTDIPLDKALQAHRIKRGHATMVLHNHRPFNKIQIDDQHSVLAIPVENQPDKPNRLAFTGIHILEPGLLSHIPKGEFSDIVDCYRGLIRSGEPVGAYVSEGKYWQDIGTVGRYILANKEALGGSSFLVPPDCEVQGSVRMEEWAVIGEKTVVEEDAEIKRSILWEKVRVKKGVKVIDSVVTASKVVERDVVNTVY